MFSFLTMPLSMYILILNDCHAIFWFFIGGIWRCPPCNSEVSGKPKYVCFCGALPNPYHKNVGGTPHSCGKVCGLQKNNSNLNYNDCQHKCTLLCHPGPCPQCVVQVFRLLFNQIESPNYFYFNTNQLFSDHVHVGKNKFMPNVDSRPRFCAIIFASSN